MGLLEELELGSVSGGWGFDDDAPPPGGDEPDKDKRKPPGPDEPRERDPEPQDDRINTPEEEMCDSGTLKSSEKSIVIEDAKKGLKIELIPGSGVELSGDGGRVEIHQSVECK